MAGMGLDLEGKDPKTGVMLFCQRYISRPVAKDDIVYTTHKHAEAGQQGYQSTVKLNCIEGHEFAGEFSATAKDAEKNAAKQVLEFFANEIATMPPSKSGKNNKRKTPTMAISTCLQPGQVDPSTLQGLAAFEVDPKMAKTDPGEVVKTAKGELNSYCSKILRRVMQKGEVMYETNMVPGGFQATVQMPGLPDEWANQIWAGEVCSKKADAEQSVAAIALEAIQADPQLMSMFNQPPKPKTWRPPMKGKGKGGGGGYGTSSSFGSSLGSSFGASSLGAGFGASSLGYGVGAPLAMGSFGAYGGFGMGSHVGGFA